VTHHAAGREALVLENEELVQRIARHLRTQMAGTIEFDDLLQAGMVGLLEAAERYSEREGAAFATFATHRIRGAMLDSLREEEWRPRSLRRRLRDIEAARRQVETMTAAPPRPRVIAATLGIPLETYFDALRDEYRALMISLDAPGSTAEGDVLAPIDDAPQPDEALEREQAMRAVRQGLQALPGLDQAILRLYYEEEYLLREIAALLNLTESRVCQILKEIIARLRLAMRIDAFARRPYRSPVPPARAASG